MSISSLISKAKEVALGVKQAIVGTSSKDISKQTSRVTKTEKAVQPYISGIKTAIVAIPATKATELPSVVAKVATGGKAVVGAVATSIKTTLQNNPVKTAVVGTAVAGYVASNPKQAVKDVTIGGNKAIEGLFNVGYNVGEFRNNPTMSNFQTIYTDNPVIAGLGSAVIAGGAGYTALKIADVVSGLGSDEIPKTKEIIATLPTETSNYTPTALSKQQSVSDIPLTPQTQVLGKAVSTTSKKKISRYRRKTTLPNIRVNVVNNSKLEKSTKYINKCYN